MCGRFSTTKKEEKLEERFNAKFYTETIEKRYNIAPTQRNPVITNHDPDRIKLLRWGLIPFWAKDPAIGNKMINARAETLLEKPSFKNLVAKKRCLVLADSFYEWKKTPGGKIPFRIVLQNEEPFAFAGLWDSWKDPEGEMLHTFTIITVPPNELMESIHNRMPAILLPEHESLWIDPKLGAPDVMDLLNPYPADDMKAYTVSTLVNSPANDVPEVVAPVDYPGDLFG